MNERVETRAVEVRAPVEQTEGTRSQVLRWLKSVGDEVALNEPLLELETDKVTVEVAAPGSGILLEILKQEQEDVGPGELLGRIDGHADARPTETARPTEAARTMERAQPVTRAMQPGVVGPAAAPPSLASSAGEASGRRSAHLLSPAVRRLLGEHSLDPSTLEGTGDGGRITVQDVMQVVTGVKPTSPDARGSASAPASDAIARAVPSAAASDAAVPADSHRVPHSAVRKRIAEHMVRSLLQTAPHVTTVFEADLSAVLAHRARHRDLFTSQGVPLTLTAYFLQATVNAIREVPEANSRWTDAALEIFDSIHIGVATALEGELVVPVLRDAGSRDLLDIARGLHDLTSRARAGHLTPSDMRGGTFTISNHGVSGSLLATPIVINQPQSAILGVGKLEKRVAVEEGADDTDRFIIQPRCYVTLTIDHRVMDGHRANRFLQAFTGCLAHWPG